MKSDKKKEYWIITIIIIFVITITNLLLFISFGIAYYKLKPISDEINRDFGVTHLPEEAELFNLLTRGGAQGLISVTIGTALLFGLFKKKKWAAYVGFPFLAVGLLNEIYKVVLGWPNILNLILLSVGIYTLYMTRSELNN